jgi:hypothetical protein
VATSRVFIKLATLVSEQGKNKKEKRREKLEGKTHEVSQSRKVNYNKEERKKGAISPLHSYHILLRAEMRELRRRGNR